MTQSYQCGIEPETEACANCKHFYQHYILSWAGFDPLEQGHCCYPRLKNRRVTDCCEHFERAKKEE